MGYYTDYNLTIDKPVEDNGKTVYIGLAPDEGDELIPELEALDVFDSVSGTMDSYGYAKWYDWEEDMCELSRKFPNYRFELQGDGEDREDQWRCYFVDGKSQYCPAHIEVTYDEYDPTKLEKPKSLQKSKETV